MAVLHSLRRYLALKGAERRLFVRAYLWLGAIDVALRVIGFQRLIERTRPPAAPVGQTVDASVVRRARRYARWVETAARYHIVRARCLHRSLVLHHWLRREGLPSELRIGVRKEGGALKAHAWVELGGYVVNDRRGAVAVFAPLASPDGQRPAWRREGRDPSAGQPAGIDMWGAQWQ